MKAKDVIVGEWHQLGFDRVIVKAAVAQGANKFTFLVSYKETREPHEVWAKVLGPHKRSKQEQALAAQALNQPHRQAILAHHAPQLERQRKRAVERGYAPPKVDWAVHEASSFQHLVVASGVTHVEFGHQLELELARHFEHCGVSWTPEPVHFDLSGDKGFRPDFYLPELDLFVELTQDDVEAKKRCKLADMATLHPNVRVIALDGDDVHALTTLDAQALAARLAKYLETEQQRAQLHRQAVS